MITVQGLANAIYEEMDATYGIPSEGRTETLKYLKVFAEGIVKYLVANTEVTVQVAVDPMSHSGGGTGTIK